MCDTSSDVAMYHELTKHRPERYASGPMSLDWATQPYPFRRYKGSEAVELPLLKDDPGTDYLDMYRAGAVEPRQFTLENVAALLELSMGLSAWKSIEGSSWALRMNPSSGNLHPTETYLAIFSGEGLDVVAHSAGVFHYAPDKHTLEKRARIDGTLSAALKEHSNGDGLLLAFSSIPWREAWKYGERAYRYCNLDVGHAMAAVRFSAALLGWRAVLVSVTDRDMVKILGFDRTRWYECEQEMPDCILLIQPAKEEDRPRNIPKEVVAAFEGLRFTGEPNQLSPDHVRWEAIEEAISLTVKPVAEDAVVRYGSTPVLQGPIPGRIRGTGAAVIRRRRSGQAYDGMTGLDSIEFFSILDKTMPRDGCAPFDLETGKTSIHLAIFVHLIKGLVPGLYMLVRDKESLGPLKENMSPEFLWSRAEGAPDTIPLYLLKEGDMRATAAYISCRQDIAGDGAFTLGMIARFRDNIEARPWSYRSLHWEAGIIGQVLYLEAASLGLSGTGIGCFYDDTVHELLGIKNNIFQSIYHFTLGKAIEDERLKTMPPYYNLRRE